MDFMFTFTKSSNSIDYVVYVMISTEAWSDGRQYKETICFWNISIQVVSGHP